MSARACAASSWGLRLYRSGTGQNGLRQLPRPECGRIQPELLAETCRGAHTHQRESRVGALRGPRVA